MRALELPGLVVLSACMTPVRMLPTVAVPNTWTLSGMVIQRTQMQEMLAGFWAHAPTEYGYCLYGTLSPDRSIVLVTGAVAARMRDASAAGFWFADSVGQDGQFLPSACSAEPVRGILLGMAHIHYISPGDSCDLSREPDLHTFLVDRRFAIEVIFCSDGRGLTFTRDGQTWIWRWAPSAHVPPPPSGGGA